MTVVPPASSHPTIPELPEPEDSTTCSETQNALNCEKPNKTTTTFAKLRARISKKDNQ